MASSVAVIGAGIAGLAVACRLAAKGHDVTVYEKNESIGGKISKIQKQGFVWDGGPSFFTDPAEFEKLFIDCGVRMHDYFHYRELDEACRYYYGKEILHGYDSPERLADELERVFSEPKANTLRYLAGARVLYESTAKQFLDAPFTLRSIMSKDLLTVPIQSVIGSLHGVHTRRFRSPMTVQFFDRFATYVGADAYRAPALFMCTPHLEHGVGAYQPLNGMRSIIEAVHALALDLGVRIYTDSAVTKISTSGKEITHLYIGKRKVAHDTVVNAGDVAHIYKMIDKDRYTAHARREHSLSAYVMYLGVKRSGSSLYLHNIFFSEDYSAEGKALWVHKTPYHDPTIYINNTSFYEPGHAPKGCENWFVMVNVPAGADAHMITKTRQNVLSKLKRVFGDSFEQRIVCEAESLTPSFLASTYNAHLGSIYGLAANSIRGAYFRPKNHDKDVRNLYHVGVTTHPGGGIPLALRSAKIVAGMIG